MTSALAAFAGPVPPPLPFLLIFLHQGFMEDVQDDEDEGGGGGGGDGKAKKPQIDPFEYSRQVTLLTGA